MLAEIIFCTLCSAGVLLVVWVVFGVFLLPVRGLCIVLPAKEDAPQLEHQVRACRYLFETGLLRGKLVVADCGLSEDARQRAQLLERSGLPLEICPAAALTEILEERP